MAPPAPLRCRPLELRWAIAAILALSAGALCSEAYARVAAPYYEGISRWVARSHPWTIRGIDVSRDGDRPGLFLRLHGEVRGAMNGATAAAGVITRVQTGAVVEGPLIFWAMLLAWPNQTRSGLKILTFGVPIFLGLEAATTVCQLLTGFAEASALIGGNADPLTLWERWSRFIESGGRDVLAVCGALFSLALAAPRAPAADAR